MRNLSIDILNNRIRACRNMPLLYEVAIVTISIESFFSFQQIFLSEVCKNKIETINFVLEK